MEIGVFNGENAKTMIEIVILHVSPGEVEYYGFDFFSNYMFQQVEQKLKETGCQFRLFKGNTVETLPRVVKTLPDMDLIFIDGGKSYFEVKSDWEHSRTLIHSGTAVFVHNYDFAGIRRMVDNISSVDYDVTIIYPVKDAATAMIRKKGELYNK